MEKFYLYLKDKKTTFMKREVIANYYLEFAKMWNLKQDFSKVLDNLRKTKLTYIFDDYWALSKENPLKLISAFLDFLNIPNYYGIDSALYMNKKVWQPPLVYYLLNTKFTKTRKINGITIKLIKIPKEIYNEKTLVFDTIKYSDYEKTCLDFIYFKKKKFYDPDNINNINLYLGLYSKFPYVRTELIENLSSEKRGQIL